MASFFPSLSSEEDVLPSGRLLNQKHASYPSSEIESDKAYANQPSVSLSYLNLLSGDGSLSAHPLVRAESSGSRNEVLFIPPTGGMQQIDRGMDLTPRNSDGNTVVADNSLLSNELMHSNGSEPIQQYHGLSLTLGSQETSSLVQLHSDLSQYTGSNFHPMLSSNMQSEIQLSQNNGFKNAHYLSFDFTGQTQDTVRFGTGSSIQNLISSKGTSFMPSNASEFTGSLCNSKYVKAAQSLLDELVSVHRAAPKLSEKVQNFNSIGQDGYMESDLKKDTISAELQESANNASPDLSPSERQDLQNKVTKLLGMLDEVDRRYKQYSHQMQVVISSFDMLAGQGAARPYTSLALRTISRQFRCLRDAIKKQIQAAQKSLGEQDVGPNGVGVLSRLRYVDQQLRQQKALQQFGVMRQPWRPQRGLPESAVSVLRAWLFEHFLHPYPKDSEKIVLGRQTGLTRSQVANWFINARVRLWKPMIEEMYKEEFGDAETEPKSSSEHAVTTQEISALDNTKEEFQGSLMSPTSNSNHRMQTKDLELDVMSNSEANASRAGLTGENEVNFGLMHMQPGKQIVNVVGDSIFPDNNASVSTIADSNITAAGDKHDYLISNCVSMNQVSLALGLQNSEKDRKRTPDEIQQKGIDGCSSLPSVPLDNLDYYYMDPVNNQNRFANTHLLSDFVA